MELARRLGVLVVLITAVAGVFASDELFKLKGRFGFVSGEDRIYQYHFLDDGRKLLIIGERSIQMWDVPENRMLVRANHQIPEFAPRGFFSSVVLLGIPRLLAQQEYVIDPEGKWIVTLEKVGTETFRSAVIRSLTDLEIIKIVRMPGETSVSTLFREPERGTVEIRGEKDGKYTMVSLETTNFNVRETYSIDNHSWHYRLNGGEKIIVGVGDSGIAWMTDKFRVGNSLTLRDVASGKIEKEYTASDLKDGKSFFNAFLTRDEKYMISFREDRIFGWEVAGDGKPLFEISKQTPNAKLRIESIHEDRFLIVFVDGALQIYDFWRNGQRVLNVTPSTPKEDLDFVRIIDKGYAVVRVQAKLHIYELSEGTLKLAIKSENDPKDRVEFRVVSDDNKLIVVSDDERVMIYEINGDGNPRHVIRRDSPKERFPQVSFFENQNVIGIARVNKSEKKAQRTDFYDVTNGKLQFVAPFAIDSSASFDVDGSMLYQVRIGGVDVWNRATRQNFTVRLDYESHCTVDCPRGGVLVNKDQVFFDPEMAFFVKMESRRTGIYDLKTGRLLQLIPAAAEMINPKIEGLPMINSYYGGLGAMLMQNPTDLRRGLRHLWSTDGPLMLVANDGRVVTLWETK